jgi:hypothetical protein
MNFGGSGIYRKFTCDIANNDGRGVEPFTKILVQVMISPVVQLTFICNNMCLEVMSSEALSMVHHPRTPPDIP